MNDLLSALDFYASGRHEKCLSNRHGEIVDWDAARNDLRQKGYNPSHESYDGSEWFVESGRLAEKAIQKLYEIIDPE
jgi:hypothetical protein